MVVTPGTLLRAGFSLKEVFSSAEYEIDVTHEPDSEGHQHVVQKTVSHVGPNGLRENVYEELFHPGSKEPYSKRYFPEERARNLRSSRVLSLR